MNQGLWNAYDLAPPFSILACKIPWSGPGGSMGSEWVRHDSVTENTECFIHRHGHPHSRVSIQGPPAIAKKETQRQRLRGYVIMIDRRTWFRTNPLREEKVGAFSTNHSPRWLRVAPGPSACPALFSDWAHIHSYLNALNRDTQKVICMPESLWLLRKVRGYEQGITRWNILCMFVKSWHNLLCSGLANSVIFQVGCAGKIYPFLAAHSLTFLFVRQPTV